MEWFVDTPWKHYPAAILIGLGTLIAIIGTRRQISAIVRPIGDPAKAITGMLGFRQTVLGLAVAGAGAAWLW